MLVETTLLLPTMLLLTFGLVTVGFIMNNYVTLTSATSLAARRFALDAPISTSAVSTTPYSDLQGQLAAASGLLGTLNAAQPTTGGIVLNSVCIYAAGSACNGNTCTSNASCSSLLASAQNDVVTVQTSYPCFIAIPMFGLNGCTLSAAATFVVQ